MRRFFERVANDSPEDLKKLPEGLLWLTIIAQGIENLEAGLKAFSRRKLPQGKLYHQALRSIELETRFFFSEESRLAVLCEVLELDVEAIRDRALELVRTYRRGAARARKAGVLGKRIS